MKLQVKPKMVYGRRAYEGFAKAIGAKMGLKVQVEDGGSACIDAAGVVRLPGMNTYQTEAQFNVTCGVVVHELAHQFYGSHKHIDPKRSRLEHDCLNAVLDVADESWVSHWFESGGNARPGDLLVMANVDALTMNWKAFADWTNPATHAWKVLCTGIMRVRIISRDRFTRRQLRRLLAHTVANAAANGVDAAKCWRLLAQARRTKACSGVPTSKRFRKLIGLAKRLAELLKPFTPPDGENGTGATASGAGEGRLSPLSGSGLKGAVEQGAHAIPDGATEASAQQGADLPGSGGASTGTSTGDRRTVHHDVDAFQLLAPAVDRIAQRIATDGDGLSRSDGLSNGPSLGQAYRLATDGQCLGRWASNDHADGLAISILLDCSGSMNSILAECAGIARAFALGMREAGPVQCLTFDSNVNVSTDFETVRCCGSTNTHLAIEKATEWLAAQHGDRWMVVVTDGQPGSREETDAACQKAHALGIRILAVGLNCKVEMPHTVAVTAGDPAHLAIELQAAAATIERS